MNYIIRDQEKVLRRALQRGKSVLMLGPRQTGKTTLACQLDHNLHINFIRPDIRLRYEKEPGILAGEIEALKAKSDQPITVILDEVQKVPMILDVVQDLIDRQVATFILSGSSARKLRRHGQTNLLPGRVLTLRLDPFSIGESIPASLEHRLLNGSLPGIESIEDPRDCEMELASYVTTYLEEEIRSEAVVRNLGPFARFLEYAAIDSGRIINAHKLSQEIGISNSTIRSYFQILEDCLIIEPIDPITETQTRKRLIRGRKYLFFDLGVRRIAAHEGKQLPKETLGHLFEQFVGLELLRLGRCRCPIDRLKFWRDANGPEVDWVIESEQSLTPVEVKWTDTPTTRDVRHIHTFLNEYPQASQGFIVCRIPRPMQLSQQVTALPWQEIPFILHREQ